MVRSVPGLDKCDGGGKWLPLDTSHQLLRQCRGQDKQNGTRAPRHRGRGWIVEFLIRGGAGETERRVAPMGRGAPRAPRGSNWTHRPSERIVGGGRCENQLLSDWACEYCEYSLWVLWVLWDCEGRWLGLKAVSLSLLQQQLHPKSGLAAPSKVTQAPVVLCPAAFDLLDLSWQSSTAEGVRSSHSVCMLCTMYIVHGIHIQNSSICQQHYYKQDRPTEISVKKMSPTIVRINQSTIDEQKGHQRWR